MDLNGKRIAILVDEQYQELEVWYPYYRFVEAGATVDFVAEQAQKTYHSKLGYPCQATRSAVDVKGSEYDAVVIPGGWCPDFMRRSEPMLAFMNQCVEAGTVLAAICHGPWMLCSTTALQGRQATSFMAIRHDVANAGATWVDEPVVVDGPVITSRTPDDLPAFCKAIGQALQG
jgi:protease I